MTELRSATFTVTVNGKEKGTSIVALTKNIKGLDEAEKKLTTNLGKEAKVQKEVNMTQKEANALARASLREYNSQQKAIKQVTDYYTQQNTMLKMSTLNQQIYNAQMKAGVEPLSKQGREIAHLVTQHAKLQAAQGRGIGSMRNMRGVAQNLGWQLQDTAVQLQMGTSALVVFSQQGSQMASAFGPKGAIIGAIIAVGGAILGVANSAMQATKEMDELIKKHLEFVELPTKQDTVIGKLNDELKEAQDNLARIEKGVIQVTQTGYGATNVGITYGPVDNEALIEAQNKVRALELALQDMEHQAAETRGELIAAGDERYWFAPDPSLTQESIEASNALMKAEHDDAINHLMRNNAKYGADVDRLLVLRNQAMQEANNAAIALDNEMYEEMDRLRTAYYDQGIAEANAIASEMDRLRKDALAADKVAATQRKAVETQRQREAIAESQAMYLEMEQLRTNHLQRMAEIDNQVSQIRNGQMSPEARLMDEYLTQQMVLSEALDNQLLSQAEHQRMSEESYAQYVANMASIGDGMVLSQMNVWSSFLGSMENTMGQLSAIAQEGSAEAKALFLITKAIAVANTLVNAHLAATQAAADPTNPTIFGKIAASEAMLALGYANAGIIAGTAIAGAFDKGGFIGSGQMGITSEYGDELVNGVLVKGPARVTSREDTAKLMNGEGGEGGGVIINQNFNINGNGDKALTEAMATAAREGAKEGYNMVAKDFTTHRGIRKTLKDSIGR